MRTTALTTAALLGLAVLTPTTATAAGETCHGQPATIVGAHQGSTLVGTSGPDVIVTAGADEVKALGGDERDVIDTGPAGQIDIVDSGQDGVPNADEVHMVGGSLHWSGVAAPGAVLDGGAGSALQLSPSDRDDLTVDAVAGTVAVSGQDTLAMTGFTTYVVSRFKPTGSFGFRGTYGPDRLVGGPGRDQVFGSGGRDVCRAEVRTKCEARR